MPFDSFAYQTISAAFPIAATASGPPACTLCASNPILILWLGRAGIDQRPLTSFPVLSSIPVTDVVSATIELRAPVLDAGTTEAGVPYAIPLSTYYDYRAVIRVRP